MIIKQWQLTAITYLAFNIAMRLLSMLHALLDFFMQGMSVVWRKAGTTCNKGGIVQLWEKNLIKNKTAIVK